MDLAMLKGLGLINLDPKEPTFFEDLFKEIIIGNPKKEGSLGPV